MVLERGHLTFLLSLSVGGGLLAYHHEVDGLVYSSFTFFLFVLSFVAYAAFQLLWLEVRAWAPTRRVTLLFDALISDDLDLAESVFSLTFTEEEKQALLSRLRVIQDIVNYDIKDRLFDWGVSLEGDDFETFKMYVDVETNTQQKRRLIIDLCYEEDQWSVTNVAFS